MSESDPTLRSSRELGLIAEFGRRQTLRVGIVFVLLNLFLPTLLYVYAQYNEWEYWTQFRGEQHAANWFSTVQCILIGLLSYANYLCAGLSHRLGTGEKGRYPWAWIVFALGFVTLALDERFQIHEALRDDFFRKYDLFTEIPKLSSGDVGLYAFLIIGFVFSPFLWNELRRFAPAVPTFAAALALSLAVVVLDSFARDFIRSWPNTYVWDYTLEELGELWAQLLFMLAFLRVLSGRLGEIGNASAAEDV